MADFVQNGNIKSAVRTLAEPIADAAAFNTIVQSVITTNPFACVAYMTAGESHPAVEKTRESYTARFIYQDAKARTVGNTTEKYNSLAGYNAGITAVLAGTGNIAAHAGTIVHDADNDAFSAFLKCHDPNGEIYIVNFSRSRVTVTSYQDDAIRTKVETWADSVAALA
ncbi:hypothetical protein [uncultured Methanoregula sp.]|uniref:hypothetical protein n=1 Tax=uncultured Methanoregula sp. TaxID=1005933 RepID=UPI002AAC2D75|nr:hypothetical protein [uncultured Methanoregula sp.]